MMRSLRLLAVSIVAAACASSPPAAPAPHPSAPPAAVGAAPAALPATGLALTVVPGDAEVEIEGVRRAPASALAAESGGIVPLAPGVYRVSVRHPRYSTWRAEVSVGSAVERIEVTLSERR
jgi:hypothetical protein